ncbi:helix-turn-helix transcriptional regulator [Halomarina rubra]|uniref:Helix-turn-helix transcriptional regulator n=1 Tax=Halomarina rubra TaxID=2071873 RepID=A0ABD6AR11_9EURY|nr:hypothetical protein [Halomarina rubra]
MQRLVVVGVLALLVAMTPLTAVTATTPATTTQQEFDREAFTIHVDENGSARWTFSYQRVLANESERTQFEAYAESFESNETQSYRNFVTRAGALTDAGTDETGREMNATSFSKDAYVRTGVNDVGVVEMSFRWTNFAAQQDGRLVVGDVFEGGLTVTENQRLVVTWDDALVPVEAEPQPQQSVEETGDALVWLGDAGGAQFLDQQPRVVFADADQLGSATPVVNDSDGGAGDGGDGGATTPTLSGGPAATGTTANGTSAGNDLPVWPFAFGAIVLVSLGGLAFRHGYLDEDDDRGASGPGGGGDTGDDPSAGATDAAAGGRTDPTPAPEPSVTDEELMSDEDRVRSLLAANGGRMKQVNIVDETGWSKSKVSMLLSEMEEDEEIHKLRVGRENIISRAGEEPDATRPTFDDE